jgi:hypothetical protein
MPFFISDTSIRKEKAMKPTMERPEKKVIVDDIRGPEPFVRQVEDDSLPAAQVLVEQKRSLDAEHPAPLFVP